MRICRSIATFVCLLLAMPAMAAVKKLPALAADPARTSISGLSSGAYMAVQYGVAFSAETIGVGVIAGGPYNCAYANLGGIYTCMRGSPSATASYYAASGFAALGQIDPVDRIAAQKVYLFSGTKDDIVKQSVMDVVRDFYLTARVPKANIQYVNGFAAGHAFISDDLGSACDVTANPYINQCTDNGTLYDQPAAVLTQIYGPLNPKAATLSAKPVAFDQGEFTPLASSMAATGYVYIPAACGKGATAKCAVHVVFHGCGQSADAVKDDVYGKLGYNEWADSNNIILLYPQVNPSFFPFNPQGCWDWWGYGSPVFQTKGGPQLSAIHAMVQRLTGARPSR